MNKLQSNRVYDWIKFSRVGDLLWYQTVWLIEGFITEGSSVALIGESGSGKTFFALDIALSIASGKSWHNKDSKQGAVVYIAGESGSALQKRIYAWCQEAGTDWESLPFYLLNAPINLNDDKIMEVVADKLQNCVNDSGPPRLIVLDTWASSLGGDENTVVDTMHGINAIRALAAPYGTALLIIHHVGKSEKGTSRGSSSFHASMDFVYLVKRKNPKTLTVSCIKSRDYAFPEIREFIIQQVTYSIPSLSNSSVSSFETSIVLQDKSVSSESMESPYVGGRQLQGLDILAKMIQEGNAEENGQANGTSTVRRSEWISRMKREGIPNSTANQIASVLITRGFTKEIAGYLSIPIKDS